MNEVKVNKSFLDWIENHPDVIVTFGVSPRGVTLKMDYGLSNDMYSFSNNTSKDNDTLIHILDKMYETIRFHLLNI